ncbi:MAG TPA: OsmC family protein [Steroidobacteraceae bacterium]|nr:OsmC family protein [Steroidobacteraceae bacterium]
MHPFPHRYQVRVRATPDAPLALGGEGLPALESLPPPQFGGPGGYWSPETMLVAAVGDCVLLTFRAIARASKFEWREASADVEGLLERFEGNSRFTQVHTRVRLVVPPGADAARARLLMEKAEKGCLVSNSLTAARHLECEVVEGA